MLTVNQRDILAGVMTDKYISEDANYVEWIEEFELHRRRIQEYDESRDCGEDSVSQGTSSTE